MTSPLTKNDFEMLAAFRYQLRRFLRFSEEVASQRGITGLQYLLLLQIRGFPGREWATIAELAERLQSHHHGVVALVSRCVKAGLIERRPGQQDRRCVEIHLTSKGAQLVAELAQLHHVQLAEVRQILRLLSA
ncbi:MarR family winged helix-turn-helix transcriptional regulator [Undibacterium oligocarboniphilum]|uniref:MarR family transcriptional regulator n=1 Tax=Undibacterium oligocarboniphilum TaxID=666702 RepID=A0A850QED3_9BURK|nr:MarR family transcriptional regulator [Undibacterium oligocarboniphilum]MBC3869943.1 MarR family transcriptional regulator [Undibacterium oligocarboniphilum]NVO77559.1 MarR family transcriptional regulator [Undibacterium oligocarboniphilum]